MWSFLSWKIKGTVYFPGGVLLWNQKTAKLSAETPVKKEVNAPKDFTTNCVWATDVFVFSKHRDLALIRILNSLRCLPSASVLTKASNTSVSKVSLSEFSIMMLKSASRVSCRNWKDKMHHIIWQDDAHWKAHWSTADQFVQIKLIWILNSHIRQHFRLQIHSKWSLKLKETCNKWNICHLDWPFTKRLP